MDYDKVIEFALHEIMRCSAANAESYSKVVVNLSKAKLNQEEERYMKLNNDNVEKSFIEGQ